MTAPFLITPAGQVHDDAEIASAVEAILSGHWAAGRFVDEFEEKLEQYLGVRFTLLCNSGSSANLLAVSALTSPLLGDRQLKPGDRVAVSAVSFPTTVAPVLQNGLVPIYLDVDRKSGSVTPESLRACLALGPKAVMIAHILGNPYHLEAFRDICNEKSMWLIEDNCDALGSIRDGHLTGSVGDLSTQSFYPAHHISTGEGGAVSTSNPVLKRILESMRDWGRDCWCAPGKANTCNKRFEQDFDCIPKGYDHKYIYTHLGYNLKMTDIQAAIGSAQMDKLDDFRNARRGNHRFLRANLRHLEHYLQFQDEDTYACVANWFGFLITVREGAPLTRHDLVQHLEGRGIMTRMLFGGNLSRQPAFRIASPLKPNPPNANYMMENSFWIGCWPGLRDTDLEYMAEAIDTFIRDGT